jgi:hypothetical protein
MSVTILSVEVDRDCWRTRTEGMALRVAVGVASPPGEVSRSSLFPGASGVSIAAPVENVTQLVTGLGQLYNSIILRCWSRAGSGESRNKQQIARSRSEDRANIHS